MDAHTLELLEYDKVRHLVAECAASALGKQRALAMLPLADRAVIEQAQARVTEMVEALEARLAPPLGGLTDVELSLRRAALGVLLDIEPLLQIRDVLDLSGRVYDYSLRLGANYPHLEAMLADLRDFRHLARAIDNVIDQRGLVRDGASPELRSIRRQLAEFEERIQNELRRMLRAPEIRKALRFPQPTVCGDHHVLPVAVNHRHKVVGVVHRTSSTGETIYIEPAKVAEISAESVVVRGAEQREIRKVLRRLTEMVQRDAEPILATLRVLGEVDFVYAKAQYSRANRMAAPRITSGGKIYLRDARHPLLEHLQRQRLLDHLQRQQADREHQSSPPAPNSENAPNASVSASGSPSAAASPGTENSSTQPESTRTKEKSDAAVVPITVHLGGEFDLLIITGPNTGGKTVALKTVGLLAAMALSGLHIPAARDSQVPMMSDVLADIGDEQSLEQSLSTFSSHISRIARILRQSGPQALVLLDELGAGTEPSEGAAIGRAILDELIGLGCKAMVTTHLNDLKTYALAKPRAENAAMEFDVQTLRPTYRLMIGQIGESCAIKIARRYKLPKALLDRARRYLRRRGRPSAELKQLQVIRQEAEAARTQALEAESAARQAAEDFRRKTEHLRQEAEVHAEIAKSRATLRKGDLVRVARFDKTGTVVRVDTRRRQAAVTVGAVEWELPLDELIPVPRGDNDTNNR